MEEEKRDQLRWRGWGSSAVLVCCSPCRRLRSVSPMGGRGVKERGGGGEEKSLSAHSLLKTEEGDLKVHRSAEVQPKQLGSGSKMKVGPNKQTSRRKKKKKNRGKKKKKVNLRSLSRVFLSSRGSPGKRWRFLSRAKFPRSSAPSR